MAVVVEDGTVVVGANSYNSAAEGDTYFTDRPAATWNDAATTAALKAQALIIGCQAFDWQYNWIGDISSDADDRLNWPRVNATGLSQRVYDETIPRQLKEGALEYAELFLNGDLNLVVEREVVKEVVGPIEVAYAEGSQTKEHPFVDNLVADISRGKTSGTRKLVRF